MTEYFIEVCQGQKTCNITASPQQLGAPVCEDQFVYLKTVYACVDMRTLLEEYVDRKHKPTSKPPLNVTETPVTPVNLETGDKISETSDKTYIKINNTSEKIIVQPRPITKVDDQFDEPTTNKEFTHEDIKVSFGEMDEHIEKKTVIPTHLATPENNLTTTSIKQASGERVAKKGDNKYIDILDSIATREYNILSEDINLDILPLEQDPNTVSVGTTDINENILEYFEQYREVIGGILVMVLIVILLSILCILAIPLIHTCKQQQCTKRNQLQQKPHPNDDQNYTQQQNRSTYFVELDAQQPSPYLLPVPELFTSEPCADQCREVKEKLRTKKEKCGNYSSFSFEKLINPRKTKDVIKKTSKTRTCSGSKNSKSWKFGESDK